MPDPSLSPAIIEARALCPTNVFEIETLEIRHPDITKTKHTLEVCFVVDTFSATGGYTTIAERVLAQITAINSDLLQKYRRIKWALVTVAGADWTFETGEYFVNFTQFLAAVDTINFTASATHGQIYEPIKKIVSELNWSVSPLVARHVVYIGDTPNLTPYDLEATDPTPLIRSYAVNETVVGSGFGTYICLEAHTPEGYLQDPQRTIEAPIYGEPNHWEPIQGSAGVSRPANSYCHRGDFTQIHKNISGAPAANSPATPTSNATWLWVREFAQDSNYIDSIALPVIGGLYLYEGVIYKSLTTTRPTWRSSQTPKTNSGISPVTGLPVEWNRGIVADFEDPLKWEAGDADTPTLAIATLESKAIIFNQLPTFTNTHLTSIVTSTGGVSLSSAQLATDELVRENVVDILFTVEIIDSELEPIFLVNDTRPHSLPIETGATVNFETRGFKLRFAGSGENGLQNLSIIIDDIDRKVSQFVARAKTFNTPIELVFRVYLSDDLSQQQNNPPTVLYLSSTSNSSEGFSATATTMDVVNAPFPNAYYKLENFPLT
jgi:hypothetical protein